ncbi:hypothetical protein GCM10025783_06600 [Amnibacterium soli]|uniref:Maltokinase n=1 Tax=Amnibacterium soli TaxID=1282736 RepID=A0ABP8YSU4_9MICO
MADPAVITGPFDSWIPGQRWFANSTGDALSVDASLPLAGGAEILFVRDATPGAEAVYQVPFVSRPSGEATELLDGPRTPEFVAALLDLLLGGGSVGDGTTGAQGVLVGWSGGAPRLTSARVLSGEQSNTSIIVEAERPDGTTAGLMVKVFRALHHGENPDVVLQSVIAAAGSKRVPATHAALVGSWPDPAAPDGTARGHLAVAQEFLADTRDAWRVALDAARAGEDFAGRARDLGAATAEVHRVLAEALPTAEADDAAREAVLSSMRARAERAAALVPSLDAAQDRIAAVLEAGVHGDWPLLQRVHGDYHLGQVLLVPDRGWVLLDFEGEPLRPMAERNLPTSRCATSPACCAPSTTSPAPSRTRAATRRRPGRGPTRRARRSSPATRPSSAPPSPRTPRCSQRSSSTRRCTSASTRRGTGRPGSPSPNWPCTGCWRPEA